jgi:ribosome production factor 1
MSHHANSTIFSIQAKHKSTSSTLQAMDFSKAAAVPEGIKPKNKLRRQSAYLNIKKAKEAAKRDERFSRKREEAKNPSLREERQSRNVPATIEAKRQWDSENIGDEEDTLGWSIDVERLAKRRKLEQEAAEKGGDGEDGEEGLLEKLKKRDGNGDNGEDENEVMDDGDDDGDDDEDSMLDTNSEDEDDASDSDSAPSKSRRHSETTKRASSPAASTATNLELSPEFLKNKFPAIFNPPDVPKILVTTNINSTLHKEAEILTTFFPNADYVRRSAHAHAHKYSVKEIAKFAHNREYTALVVLMEAHHAKVPDGLDVVVLPSGPHFHFSIVCTSKLQGWIQDNANLYTDLVKLGRRQKTPRTRCRPGLPSRTYSQRVSHPPRNA